MNNLYARIVLFFIRPGLELNAERTREQSAQAAVDAVFVDMVRHQGPIDQALASVYGISRRAT